MPRTPKCTDEVRKFALAKEDNWSNLGEGENWPLSSCLCFNSTLCQPSRSRCSGGVCWYGNAIKRISNDSLGGNKIVC